jgi:RNA polymerase sigma-70 factor, ECF subfamily
MNCTNSTFLKDQKSSADTFVGAATAPGIPVDVFSRGCQASAMQHVLSNRLPSLYRNAYRVLGNTYDAEDAVQDALLSAHKHLNQFRGDSQLSSWVTTIVINCARQQLRRRPRVAHVWLDQPKGEEHEFSLADSLADHRPNPELECQNAELHSLLMKSLARLSPTLRTTFQLREVDGLSTSEAAELLGVPAGTIKARLTRARAKLRKFLGRSYGSCLGQN